VPVDKKMCHPVLLYHDYFPTMTMTTTMMIMMVTDCIIQSSRLYRNVFCIRFTNMKQKTQVCHLQKKKGVIDNLDLKN